MVAGVLSRQLTSPTMTGNKLPLDALLITQVFDQNYTSQKSIQIHVNITENPVKYGKHDCRCDNLGVSSLPCYQLFINISAKGMIKNMAIM